MLVKKDKKGVDELLEIDDLRDELAGMRSQYAIGSIATLIETLQEALDQATETESKKVFYDKDLGKSISESLTKVIGALNKEKTDLSPLVNVIAKQNELIQAMLSKKPENNDAKYQALLEMTLGIISKNTEFLKTGINIPAAVVNVSNPKKEDKEWVFTSVRDKNGNLITTGKTK